MRSQYSVDEQETIINMFPKIVSETAEVYTCIPYMMQRIKKLAEDYPDDVALVVGDGYIDATVPRSWIKIQPKRKSNMTTEQKEASMKRLAEYRQSKKEAEQNDAS